MPDSISNMVTQGVITNVFKDDQQHLRVQYKHKGKIKDAYVQSQYGFLSNPPIGNRVLVISVGAEAENKAGFCSNTRDLKQSTPDDVGETVPGEVLMQNQLTGTFSYFDSDGNIIIKVSKDQKITVIGDGNLTVGGALTINVTGAANITAATATITTSGDTTIVAPTVKMTGDLEVDGDITDNFQTQSKTVGNMRDVYNPHTHIESGGGTTQPPIPQI